MGARFDAAVPVAARLVALLFFFSLSCNSALVLS